MIRSHLGYVLLAGAVMTAACDDGNRNSAVGDTRPDAAATARAGGTSNTSDNPPMNMERRDGDVMDRERATGTSGAIERNADALAEAGRDGTITMKIQASYASDATVKGMNIDVDTNDGVVTLSGRVASAAEKDVAERIAKQTEGVKRVVNQLKVGREAGAGR
mgnify:CR=1 FL=1